MSITFFRKFLGTEDPAGLLGKKELSFSLWCYGLLGMNQEEKHSGLRMPIRYFPKLIY